jgi:hypothetical protein
VTIRPASARAYSEPSNSLVAPIARAASPAGVVATTRVVAGSRPKRAGEAPSGSAVLRLAAASRSRSEVTAYSSASAATGATTFHVPSRRSSTVVSPRAVTWSRVSASRSKRSSVASASFFAAASRSATNTP